MQGSPTSAADTNSFDGALFVLRAHCSYSGSLCAAYKCRGFPFDPGAAASASTTQDPGLSDACPLSCPILRIVRSCPCGCRTVEGIKTAWLGNAVSMMHYLRIVNAGGRQKWHGHDHKDKAHATLPIWRGTRPATVHSRPGSFQASTENGLGRSALFVSVSCSRATPAGVSRC
jgi:hypothetical protein